MATPTSWPPSALSMGALAHLVLLDRRARERVERCDLAVPERWAVEVLIDPAEPCESIAADLAGRSEARGLGDDELVSVVATDGPMR